MILAGGTGGAKLAAAIQPLVPPGHLTVIANTADDDEFWGHLVSPDVDAVIYRLAGVFNDAAGYGVKDDTFHLLEALARLGEPAWFRIGDKDFATHVLRTEMLGRGRTLTECALALCDRFGLVTRVLPMTNERVRTRFHTPQAESSPSRNISCAKGSDPLCAESSSPVSNQQSRLARSRLHWMNRTLSSSGRPIR